MITMLSIIYSIMYAELKEDKREEYLQKCEEYKNRCLEIVREKEKSSGRSLKNFMGKAKRKLIKSMETTEEKKKCEQLLRIFEKLMKMFKIVFPIPEGKKKRGVIRDKGGQIVKLAPGLMPLMENPDFTKVFTE